MIDPGDSMATPSGADQLLPSTVRVYYLGVFVLLVGAFMPFLPWQILSFNRLEITRNGFGVTIDPGERMSAADLKRMRAEDRERNVHARMLGWTYVIGSLLVAAATGLGLLFLRPPTVERSDVFTVGTTIGVAWGTALVSLLLVSIWAWLTTESVLVGTMQMKPFPGGALWACCGLALVATGAYALAALTREKVLLVIIGVGAGVGLSFAIRALYSYINWAEAIAS